MNNDFARIWKVTAHTLPWYVSSITSMTVHSTPWIYSAIPLAKSLVTLKTFLPMTTGSMKLTSVAPEENTVLFMKCRQLEEWLYWFYWNSKDSTAHTRDNEVLNYEAGTFCHIHYCVWHGEKNFLEVARYSSHSVVDNGENISAHRHRIHEANVNRSCNRDKTNVLKIPFTELCHVWLLQFRGKYPSLNP